MPWPSELKDRRLTQEENFLTTAVYHFSVRATWKRQLLYLSCTSKRIHAARLLTMCWGSFYRQMGRTEEALQEFLWATNHARVPAAADSSNASRALMILGRFEEAKEYLTNGGRKDP